MLLRKPFQLPPVKWSDSIFSFLANRGDAFGQLLVANYVIKLMLCIFSKFGISINSDLAPLLSNASLLCFTAHCLEKLVTRIAKKMPVNDNRTKHRLVRFTTVCVWTMVGTLCMGYISNFLKIPYSRVLAVGGIGGLTVSLAAKDLAANFLGGMLLLVNEPFSIGDLISFKAGGSGITGKVEHIGWTQTTIRDGDTKPTYVPNSQFTQATITNMDRNFYRKYDQTVSVRFTDYVVMEQVVKNIRLGLATLPKLELKAMPFRVHFTKVGDQSLDIKITCFFKANLDEFLSLQAEANLKVIGAVVSCGASMALPTTVVQMSGPVKDAIPLQPATMTGLPTIPSIAAQS